MGIAGLLPFLKNSARQTNIKEFRGCTVAIDTYCWLHRGAFACADKLALGEPTDQYVFYCMKYVNNLLSFGVRPILVFDGGHLPSKKEVEKQRRERREVNRKKAAQLLREGRRSEARDALQKCVDINSHMAVQLMKACRDKGVDCLVAPYEADSQLAYLNKIGIAQVIITEDSDLVLFGCEKIMFKMDFAGNGVLIEREHLNKAMGLKPDIYTFEKFRHMCILSGCDYLANLPGIGLKKATRVFQRTRQPDMKIVLKKMPTILNMPSLTVTIDYIEGFFKAENTFLYQLVYDPTKRKVVPLNPYPDHVDPSQLLYAGPPLDADRAYQLALGNLDVYTGEFICDFDPETFKPKHRWDPVSDRGSKDMLCNLSIWDKNYRPMSRKSKVKAEHSGGAFDISRGSTAGKEVKVSLALPGMKKKQLSPLKRHREDEHVLSERDLTAMYSASASQSTSDEPPLKKIKTEAIPTITIQETPCEIQEDNEIDPPRSPTPPPRSPTPPPSNPSPQTSSIIDTSPSSAASETPAVRRSVNVFRAGSSVKKRFSLNAAKTQVTSRFFSSSVKPFKKSEFFDKMGAPHADQSIKLTDTENTNESPEDVSNNGAEDRLTMDENMPSSASRGHKDADSYNSKEKSAESAHGSFSFSKSKLSTFKSNFDREAENKHSLLSSSCSNKQFKPVISKSCDISTESSKNIVNRTSLERDSRNKNLTDISLNGSELSESNTSSQADVSLTVEASQKSVSLWSIDSGSFGLSQKASQSFDLTDCSENAQNEPSTSGSVDNGESTGATSGHVLKSPNSAGKPAVKAGCRSSGLSKKSKPAAAAKENKGQKSITNFFSKFSFNQQSKGKMSTDRKPLSPKKNN